MTIPNQSEVDSKVSEVQASQSASQALTNGRYTYVVESPLSVNSGVLTYHVDEYLGPLGEGYQIVFTYTVSGSGYQRTVNVGPEIWRNQGWKLMEAE